MITQFKVMRNYSYMRGDRTYLFPVNYTVQVKDGILHEVYTEHEDGSSSTIEKTSECWGYFLLNYKK